MRVNGRPCERSAASLASTCRGMRERMDARAPGLALRLHQHQEAGLAWMRRRERPPSSSSAAAAAAAAASSHAPDPATSAAAATSPSPSPSPSPSSYSSSMPPVPDPQWRGPLFTAVSGTSYWLNLCTGELSASPPAAYTESPGGLLCDEPGRGRAPTSPPPHCVLGTP